MEAPKIRCPRATGKPAPQIEAAEGSNRKRMLAPKRDRELDTEKTTEPTGVLTHLPQHSQHVMEPVSS